MGVNKFVFEADPPDVKRIPDAEILGVTVILLTCAYDGREFVRVGYYVNNEYDSDELNADPPAKPQVDHIRRNVLAEKPRVTRFAIKWDSEASAPAEFPPEQPEADLAADEEEYGADEADDGEDDEAAAGVAEKAEGEDAAMNGTEEAKPAQAATEAEGEGEGEGEVDGDEDEMSEDGSVDIEGESDEEIEDEEEGEGADGAEGDEMDVDEEKHAEPHPVEVMSH